jgi:hypothetical protein
MVLSSLYTVPLRCSCGWDCLELEFLDLREYLVWLNYDLRCRRIHWMEPGHLHTIVNIDTHVYLFTIPCRLFECTVTLATPGIETYIYLHWTTPKTEADVRLTQATAWDRSAALSLWKNSLCENFNFLSHICKSSLRALIRSDVVSDTYVTPDRILVFAVIGCWFPSCSVSHVPRPGVLRALWKWPVWLFYGRNSRSWEHVQAMKQATGWRQNFRSKNKAKPNLIQDIAKVTWNISMKARNIQFYMKHGSIERLKLTPSSIALNQTRSTKCPVRSPLTWWPGRGSNTDLGLLHPLG